jgi:hypothetical protein
MLGGAILKHSFDGAVASALYFVYGFLLPSFILWHEGRVVSDILGFCGAWNITFWYPTYYPKLSIN